MSITKQLNQLARMFDPHHVAMPLYEMPQTKPDCLPAPSAHPLPRATPEAEGISSHTLALFLRALANDPELNMHNLMILRHGKVILDVSFRGYDTSIRKYTYSACKSIVSLAIGVLIDRGQLSLSDKLENFVPSSELNAITRLKIKDITVEALLTMSTGSSFNEMGIVTEENWIRGFLSSSFKSGNDQLFEYNSMNTYMLAVIACKVSGTSLTELLREAFFDPMGITDYHFETCPMGIEKGGWGLYIRPEDMAKFGLLILRGGEWNGKRLISEEYLKKATSLQRKTPPSYGAFHYGYQMWVGRERDTVLFNGMHGQNLLIDRTNDMVFVTNAGNNEMFQQSSYFKYVEHYFCRDRHPLSLPDDPEARKQLSSMIYAIHPHAPRQEQRSFFSRLLNRNQPMLPPWYEDAQAICGRIWYPTSDRANCMGIFPRMFQITRGRFTSGLESVSFAVEEEKLYLYWNEKEQKTKLLLGFGKPAISRIAFGKEIYLVGSDFRFARDEYDRLVLMLQMDVLETPYSRLMKFRFCENGGMILSLEEKPGSRFLLSLGEILTEDLKAMPLIGQAMSRVDPDYPEFLIRRVLEPNLEMTQCAQVCGEMDAVKPLPSPQTP